MNTHVFVLKFLGKDEEEMFSSLILAIERAGKIDRWMRLHTRWKRDGDTYRCGTAENDAIIRKVKIDE